MKKVQIEDIQSKPFIFNKILIGDKGDSVPSVWSYEQNGKPVNFTQRKADVVYSAFLESEWCDESFTTLINSAESDEFLNWLSGLVIRTSKGVDSTENRNKVKSNILRNFKLMWLDSSMIPEFVANGCIIKSITSDPTTNLIVMDIRSDYSKVKPIDERRDEIIDEILDKTLKNKNI